MVQLSSAFLICTSFLHMTDLHPDTYASFEKAERMGMSLTELISRIAYVDSSQIPMAECIIEQYAPKRVYYAVEYPKPPYYGEELSQ